MILFCFFIILLVLFILPFLPGLREYVIEEDARPLHISMSYIKDPRYFGQAFRKVLLAGLQGKDKVNGLCLVELSKQEIAEIADTSDIGEGSIIDTLYYIKRSFQSGPKVLFEKEIYARGNSRIGDYNQLRALACDGDIQLGKGTKVIRWLDSEGRLAAGEQCNLGISTSCSKDLVMEKGCVFKRLYGFPICTGHRLAEDLTMDNVAYLQSAAAATSQHQSKIINKTSPVDISERKLSSVSPHSIIDNSIITVKTLTIGTSSLILGDIKTYGDLIIEEGVTIKGNIFAEGDIYIGPYSRLEGTVFTQGRIVIHEGVVIGSPDHIKSVVCKRSIVLHYGVRVYGYVSTEGEGEVV